MIEITLVKLLLVLSAILPSAQALEGHFVYQGQQQTLDVGLGSEFLVNLLTPKTREVVFGPVHSLTTQFEGDSLVQYEASQKVQINNLIFDKATYFEFKDFVKIAVGNPESENYFTFIVGKDSISAIESVQASAFDGELDWNYKTHWVESTLQQKDL